MTLYSVICFALFVAYDSRTTFQLIQSVAPVSRRQLSVLLTMAAGEMATACPWLYKLAQKTRALGPHNTVADNFANRWPIFKMISSLDSSTLQPDQR